MKKLVLLEDDPLLLETHPSFVRERLRTRRDLDDDWEFRSLLERPDVLTSAWRGKEKRRSRSRRESRWGHRAA